VKPSVDDCLAAGIDEAIGECFFPAVRAGVAACLERDAALAGSAP